MAAESAPCGLPVIRELRHFLAAGKSGNRLLAAREATIGQNAIHGISRRDVGSRFLAGAEGVYGARFCQMSRSSCAIFMRLAQFVPSFALTGGNGEKCDSINFLNSLE